MVKGFYDSETKIKIDDKTYHARLAKIDKTELGYEDHRIFTAMIDCDMGGHYVTVGGYGLDQPVRDDEGNFIGRDPTSFGMAWIVKAMDVLGARHWESIKGKLTYVLMDKPYGSPMGFADPFDSFKFFIFQDLADEYFPKETDDNQS